MQVQRIDEDGLIEYKRLAEIDVPPDEYPFLYYAYAFPPAGLLIGRPTNADLIFETWGVVDQEAMRKFAPGDKEGIRMGPSQTTDFCRMLAKVSHAYATAELGDGSFEPALARYARGRHLDGEPHWIGGDLSSHQHTPPKRLHEIGWEVVPVEDRHFVVVRLRLFCTIGAPAYRVVVGELKRPIDELPFLTQPLYTIDIKGTFPAANFVPVVQAHRGTRS